MYPLARFLQLSAERIKWLRLLWVLFITCYAALFFYNFFRPFNDWLFVYIYTIILVVWLCSEYYQKHYFFQSGLLGYYHWAIRAAFALLFYSSFIIGLATTIWWQDNKIGLYPLINIIGIILLIVSIYVRWQFYMLKEFEQRSSTRFYTSIYILLLSMAFGYGSIFLFPYVIVVGFPLIYLHTLYDTRRFKDYKSIINSAKSYYALQQAYIALIKKHQSQEKRRGKK